MDQTASAVPRLAAGKIASSRVCEPGIIGPASAPCSTRNTRSTGKLQATPQRKDASVTSSTETVTVRTTPNRSMSQPVSGTEIPFARA